MMKWIHELAAHRAVQDFVGVVKSRGSQASDVIRVEVTKLSGDGTVPVGGGAFIFYAGL